MELAQLRERIAEELERPRPLSEQVGRHLSSTYGVGREEMGSFLDNSLAGLEDFEIDLILSPIFTPALSDQAIFAPLLGLRALEAGEINGLIGALVERPTRASLETDDGTRHSIVLREVSIERFVRRLPLDGSLPVALLQQLLEAAPKDDLPTALAVARRAVWNVSRRAILERYVAQAQRQTQWALTDLLHVLRLVETYEPATLEEFRERLPGWTEAVRRDANAALNPRPFFNERVEDLHGGGRDQRRAADPKAADRQMELISLQRLGKLLAAEEANPGQ
jgi:hypothetical protein